MKIDFNITALLNERVAESAEMAKAIQKAIEQFINRDWGIVPPEDKKANDIDLKNRDGHVLARYKTPEGDIYINMEFYPEGENVALLMFCDEY